MSLEHEADPRRHGAHPNEVLKRRTAEQALTAALAREQALRAALQATLDDDCDDLTSAVALLAKVEAALAAPTDDTALREFGLKVRAEALEEAETAINSATSDDLWQERIHKLRPGREAALAALAVLRGER